MPHYDPAPHRDARGNERWILLGSFGLALGLLAAIVLEDYEPVKLAPVFMLLAWFPLIALHEGGHALMARLVGWEVDVIVVGFGGVAFAFEVFGIPCAIKMYPLGGFMRPAPLDTRGARWKSALVYLGGPGAELFVVLVLVAIFGFDEMTARSDRIAVIAAQGASVAALLSVITNLVPRAIDTERGTSWTDGLGFFRSFFRPQSEIDAQVREALIDRIEHHAELRRVERALSICERATRALPNDARMRSVIGRALRHAMADLDPEARARALDGRALPEAVRARLRATTSARSAPARSSR